ncbi:MAG: hypothetical protein U0836_11020 [Pirellulales bacterium]|jgi:hypothetical protein
MPDESTALISVSEMKLALSSARTLDDFARIRLGAEALRTLAQKAHLSLDIQNEAAECKLRAERAAGRMLADLNLYGGDRKSRSSGSNLKLRDLGISKDQSALWQREAAISEKDLTLYLAARREAGEEISSANFLKTFTRFRVRPKRPRSPHQTLEELRAHRNLLEQILRPYCEREIGLRPEERRHVMRVLRELERLLRELVGSGQGADR